MQRTLLGVEHRVCEGCEQDLPASAYYLKDGRINAVLCKACTVSDNKLRRQDPKAHKARVLARREARKAREAAATAQITHKACTQCGVEKELGEFRVHRGLHGRSSWCRECERQYTRDWTEDNRDEHNERRREAWAKKEHTEEERAAAAERARKWYADPENKDRNLQNFYTWVRDNRDARNAMMQKRRARKLGVDATLTSQEWEEILTSYHRSCAYCQTDSETMTMDHVVPLSKGGAHTKENVVPACRSCNSKKGARPVEVMQESS